MRLSGLMIRLSSFFHTMNNKIPWAVTQIDWNISRVSSEFFIISYILIAIAKMKEEAT